MVKLRLGPWDLNQTIAWEPEGHFPPPPQLYSTLEPHQQRVRKLVISNLTLIVIGGRWSAVRGVGWEEDKENIWVCLMLWWSLWTQWSRLMTMKKPDYVLTTKYIFTVQPPTHQWLIWTWTVWSWSIACLLSDHHQNPSFRPFPTKLSVLCLPGIKGVSYLVQIVSTHAHLSYPLQNHSFSRIWKLMQSDFIRHPLYSLITQPVYLV